jgi:signal transduction histidine kinase/BarA-like signal transduction histidine kinase
MAARILVVDDETDLELLMRQKFRHKISAGEFEFEFAFNGTDALKKVQEGAQFDMVVTDINMPGMDGLTLLAKLREHDSSYKAVVVSAYGDMANIRTAMNRGAFDFLTKPINFKDLEITIEKTLQEVRVIRHGLAAREKLEKAMIENEIALIEKEKAEESKKFQQQFLANMSHEIRTPMNAVIGMTNLVLKTSLDEQQSKYLNAIKISSDNLLVIINDILEISKIEAGKLGFENIAFTLDEVFNNVSNVLRFKAEEKGLKLVLEQSENVPKVLLGDSGRLNQVLINLVGNAIKFTEKGGVEVRCRLAGEKDKKAVIEFTVTDTGIGIPQEKIDLVFESFTQASSDTSRKFGGTGLGLTISKQLVEMQGGAIRAVSEIGKGSTFTFTIPYFTGNGTEISVNKEIAEEHSIDPLRKVNILLVEDNEFNRIVAVDTLKDYLPGATVTIAVNGKDAIEKLPKGNYDLVLMDVQMPEMNGYDATQYIRKQFSAPLNAIPILALTANATKEEIDKCRESGMDDYISKPFVPENLIRKMSGILMKNSQIAK